MHLFLEKLEKQHLQLIYEHFFAVLDVQFKTWFFTKAGWMNYWMDG